MNRKSVFALQAFLLLLAGATARADVWYWFDANGATHYVDSDRAIYTWRDDQGKVYYSDKPDHEDAIRVQLFWHSKGTLEDLKTRGDVAGALATGFTHPGEATEQPADREAVVARNCERATEILHSYENAPKLYRTDESGNRHILTDVEYAAEVADAREKKRVLCGQ